MALLPEVNYDAVIVGTGLVESIVSAALGRIGKKVLHLDENDYYGSQYSTLALDEFLALLGDPSQQQQPQQKFHMRPQDSQQQPEVVDTSVQEMLNSSSSLPIFNRTALCTAANNASPDDLPRIFIDALTPQDRKEVRRYAIDLYCTKLLYCYGPLVQTLIQSAIGRYLEFKCFDAVLVYVEKSFQKVPCSKSEIFNNKFISLIEKRYLMKFLEFCMEQMKAKDPSEQPALYKEFENQPFLHLLKKFNLSARLQSFILYAIAMLDSDQDTSITTRDGLQRIRYYISSLERYGPSPFLYPMYGSSELSQAYCRVSAVYGSTFILRRSVQAVYMAQQTKKQEEEEEEKVVVVKEQVKGIKCSVGQDIVTRNLVLNRDYTCKQAGSVTGETVLRCVNVLNSPLLDPAQYKTTDDRWKAAQASPYGALIAVIPPNTFPQQINAITMVQMDSSVQVVPRGKVLVTFEMRGGSFDALKSCVDFFLPPPKPVAAKQPEEGAAVEGEKESSQDTPAAEAPVEEAAPVQQIAYQVMYKYVDRTRTADAEADKLWKAENVFVADDIDCLSDMEKTVAQAQDIFNAICPGAEFLPRLPNPEDQEEVKNEVFDVAAKLLGVDKEMEQQQQQKTSSQEEEKQQQVEQQVEPVAAKQLNEEPTRDQSQ